MGVEEKIRRIRESSVKVVYVMLFLISLTFSDKLLKLGKRLLTISRWRNKLPNVKSETRNEKNSRIARIAYDELGNFRLLFPSWTNDNVPAITHE